MWFTGYDTGTCGLPIRIEDSGYKFSMNSKKEKKKTSLIITIDFYMMWSCYKAKYYCNIWKNYNKNIIVFIKKYGFNDFKVIIGQYMYFSRINLFLQFTYISTLQTKEPCTTLSYKSCCSWFV